MRNVLLLLLVFGLSLSAIQCVQQSETEKVVETEVAITEAELVKRGEYLTIVSGCHDCHSPKVMTPQGPALDTNLIMSGHPAAMPLPPVADPKVPASGQWVLFHPGLTVAVGPWGTSFAANLTPHESGIGTWTIDQFKKALREGKLKGMDNTRPLLPPMPWQTISQMTDEDLEAIFAYLKSLPPIDNVVPSPVPPVAIN